MKKLIFLAFIALIWLGCTQSQRKYATEHNVFTEPGRYAEDIWQWYRENPYRLVFDIMPFIPCENHTEKIFVPIEKLHSAYQEGCFSVNKMTGMLLYAYYANQDTLFMSLYDSANQAFLMGAVILITHKALKPVYVRPTGEIVRANGVLLELNRFRILDDLVYFQDKQVLFVDGSRKFGMKHIRLEHTIDGALRKGKVHPKKSFYIQNDEKYIIDLNKKVLRNPVETYTHNGFTVVEGYADCEIGMKRKYRIVLKPINDAQFVVYTSYPLTRIPLAIASQYKLSDYITIVYKLQNSKP